MRILPFAQSHQGGVHDNTSQPGCNGAAAFEFAKVAARGDKRVLHGVLGVFLVPKDAVRNSDEPLTRRQKELLKDILL